MSRYAAISKHLETIFGDSVTLTFAEIEEVLGFPLPPSARRHGPWWSNGTSNAVWVSAGWKSEARDMAAQHITFRRILPGGEVQVRAPTLRSSTAFDGSVLAASEFASQCDVAVRFAWRHLGPVTLSEADQLAFPAAPKAAGLYRMQLVGADKIEVYVGEAIDLKRRFGNYRRPGSTQQTSLRINALLKDSLARGVTILLDVAYDDVALIISGNSIPADLSNKAVRRVAEQAAIVAHHGIDVDMLNR